MSLPEGAVRRPITVLMCTIAVLTFGLLAAGRLPVDLLPDLSYPTLTVETEYPDAAPISVEQYVTRPVEEAVGVIPGVREMRSTSRAGISEVVLEFEWGEQMDFAALDVREKLGLAQLPREVEPSRVLRFDPSLDPVVRLAFEGDRPVDELRQLAERWLKPRLEATDGVASAKVRGGLTPEIITLADEDRLRALDLELEDVGIALTAENINQPGGTLQDFNATYLVRTLHEFRDLDQLRRTVIRETQDGRIRVEDVAAVSRGYRDREEVTRLGGREVVTLDLYRAGSANTVQVAEALKASLEDIRGEMAEDLSLVVLSDQSTYITQAIDEVVSAGLIGGILAILVLYFFLGDPRATAVIGVSIPVSAIATFLPLEQLGVSLNIMSLGGLALGIGMLVDNSIVVLESIDRHRGGGASRRDAAIQGASEVSGAVTASTLTTLCVFLPIVFVEGIAGQLFKDQAITVCVSLLVSLLTALTLVPALTAFGIGAGRTQRSLFPWAGDPDASPQALDARPFSLRLGGVTLGPMGDGVHWQSKAWTILLAPLRIPLLLLWVVLRPLLFLLDRAFALITWPLKAAMAAVSARYPGWIRGALGHRWIVLTVAFALFGASVAALPWLGADLVPTLSQGSFAFRLELAEGTPLMTTAAAVAQVEAPLLEDPRFLRVFSTIGAVPAAASGRATTGENLAQLDLVLAEGVDEDAAADVVRDALRRLPQIKGELLLPALVTTRAPLVVRLFQDDLAALTRAADVTTQALRDLPEAADVASSVTPGSPEVRFILDRERAATLGLTGEDIAMSLRRKIRGEIVGQFREGEERIDIRLRSAAVDRDSAEKVARLGVSLPDGTVVPVSAIARVITERGPASILRVSGSRVAEVSASAGPGVDLGEALAAVQGRLKTLSLPPGTLPVIGGQAEELERSFQSLALALSLAIFLVFAVMAAQFESLIHPIVILVAVPLGLVGIVLGLGLAGLSISVLALIGAVMLAGIVVNNAIVFVDAVNRRRQAGEALEDALTSAGAERLRPILMTTTTTVLALLPMALGLGAGDELRAPLAVTVIGGLTIGTILTLIVIPCLYRVVASGGGDASWAGEASAPPPGEA